MVNKLETKVSSDLVKGFEAFSSDPFTSFLAGYNCSQQLYINETKTNNFSILSAFEIDYRIVASSSPSRIEAHAGLFRLLMKGIFNPYVL